MMSKSKVWTDPETGLMWQVEVENREFTWQEAFEYAKELKYGGYDDWRLPTKDELKSIMTRVKKDYHNYFIKKELMKSISFDIWSCYWSATEQDSLNAWNVCFSFGYGCWSSKTNTDYVICVLDSKKKNDK